MIDQRQDNTFQANPVQWILRLFARHGSNASSMDEVSALGLQRKLAGTMTKAADVGAAGLTRADGEDEPEDGPNDLRQP
jgi:hypothetical protein